jgi:hypothetical protein
MTRAHIRLAAGAAALACAALPALSAERTGFSVAGRFGTPGFGLEAVKAISPRLNLRSSLNLFNYRYGPGFDGNLSYQGVGADVHFDPTLELKNGQMLADVYFSDGFHFTGGLVYNRNRVRVETAPQVAITINDQVYQTDQIGTLIGTSELGKRWAPYAGIGFGNPVDDERRVTILLDLGVIFQGTPTLALTTSGAVSNVPGLQDDLNVAADKLRREHLDKSYLKYYPVLSLGVAVRLF